MPTTEHPQKGESTKIRALIVDDEPLARERLRSLLERDGGVEVLGECGDGREALESIHRARPDLVFLDIQMPELDGFGVLSGLDAGSIPAVVFVTAYDQFAIKAFEVHALDYLLKPFDDERFGVTMSRVRSRLEQDPEAGELREKLNKMLEELRPASTPADRLAVKTGGKVVLVRIQDIDWVEAADNYVNLHAGAQAHLLRETMSALEERLPSNRFVRISRSTIVNLDRIKELQPLFHGEYAVLLHDGTRLTLSRGYREKLSVLLGESP
jgi:two-component system LytT family response regulator